MHQIKVVNSSFPTFISKFCKRFYGHYKGNNCHIVLLGSIKYGYHSLAKMGGWLLKIGTIELQQIGVNGLLEEVIKVLKTGGKFDECLSILTYYLINSRP
jgi:hypothetical protein